MPLKQIQLRGVKGWKWGDNGKHYFGKDAKEKAEKQGRAIGHALEANKDKKK